MYKHTQNIFLKPFIRLSPRLLVRLGLVVVAACLPLFLLSTGVLALFNNGGFESGDFTGWTKSTFLNPSLSGSEPFTGSSIVRDTGGTDKTFIRGPFTAMSQTDSNTGGILHYPRVGSYCAVVNYLGATNNANSLKQQSTTASGDVQPDGKIHVQFTWAAVIQNPDGHTANDMPFIYIYVKNVTQDRILYQQFYTAGSGAIWQNAANDVQFTDWQVINLEPTLGELAVGDTVEVEAIAAGCAQGGHWAYLYIDGFGSNPPVATAIFNPWSASVGGKPTASGSGWAAGDIINGVTVGGVTATHTLVVDGDGVLSGDFTIPTVATGVQSVVITGADSGINPFSMLILDSAPAGPQVGGSFTPVNRLDSLAPFLWLLLVCLSGGLFWFYAAGKVTKRNR